MLTSIVILTSSLDTAGKKRKSGKDAAQFKTDEETGKMVIDEGADEEEEAAGDNVEGAAYKESLTSVDGFTRGPNGRVKFNKDTKKRRREEAADEDVEMADPDAAPATNKKPRSKKQEKPVGHEFKAKVSDPLSCCLRPVIDGSSRKLAATSKSVGWIHTRMCRFRKQQKRRARWASLARDSLVHAPRRCPLWFLSHVLMFVCLPKLYSLSFERVCEYIFF